MPLINTAELKPGQVAFSDQIYNGLDCCVTLEVFNELSRLHNSHPEIYSFERALQAPAMDMMLRGFRVDESARQEAINLVTNKIARLQVILNKLAHSVIDKDLNPRSQQQLQKLFYETMRLPKQWVSKKGERKLSMDREVLEKLELYFHAKPFIACIMAIREEAKNLEVLTKEVDPDGRLRTSYNIAGTETGRWSSSQSVTGTGGNQQNVTPDLRFICVADPGYKICAIDLEQAESREVGWLCGTLFNDWTYYNACLSGDLHTITARLVWPRLAWSGDLRSDRLLAESPFYRHFSYRDMAKRGGHGCLTTGHDVLTKSGWQDISIVGPQEEIACWTLNRIFWEVPSHWEAKPYTGILHTWEGTSLSLDMTHDHRVLSVYDPASSVVHENPAEAPPHGFIPLGKNYKGGDVVVPARLIAAFQADGHQKSTNCVEFHLHKERKKERLRLLCKIHGYEYKENFERQTITVYNFYSDKFPGAYMLNWTKECIVDYVDELKYWDGHQSATAVAISSTCKTSLEWFQTLGRLVGIGGNIQKPRKSGFGSNVYTLQQNHRLWATGSAIKTKTRQVINEPVYCPTVSSGAFLVRRNGKICVTGNTNYYGTPFTMARHLKVRTKLMEEFQSSYFGAYPALPKWHRDVAQRLQTTSKLTTVFGRTRHFFGRANDDTTLREAIAYSPQSATADRMNLVLWRLWKYMPEVQMLAQVHDAVYFQYPDSLNDAEIVTKALSYFEIPIKHGDRVLSVPGEAKLGYNWGNWDSKENPNGLKKFKGEDLRKRLSILDSVM